MTSTKTTTLNSLVDFSGLSPTGEVKSHLGVLVCILFIYPPENVDLFQRDFGTVFREVWKQVSMSEHHFHEGKAF